MKQPQIEQRDPFGQRHAGAVGVLQQLRGLAQRQRAARAVAQGTLDFFAEDRALGGGEGLALSHQSTS